MIEDPFLSKITKKKSFTEEEYEKLRKKYKTKLEKMYKEAAKKQKAKTKKTITTTPSINKKALQSELAILQTDLEILTKQGYQKLLEEREKRAIQTRIQQINNMLKGG